ncbi:MAG: hypothetical protein KGH70_02125, partial [Rhodospirillales bacterium]|nr:hypothetical protein [Rhodospirillales bacterium]
LCHRRIMLKNAMSNTPFAPASSKRGNSQTWVKSQWKNPAFPGHFSVEINITVITEALAARFPFLERPGEVLGVAQEHVALRLQNLEAAALTSALQALWRHDIPGVPVHDSILVPDDKVAVTMAEGELWMGYKEHCGGAEIRTVVEREVEG